MNSLFGDNDLVADSEGEDDIYVLPTQKHKETAVNSNESTVSQFTSNQPIATRDTISSFSATAGDISLVANASASSTSTRPRPKPAYKGAPGNDSLSTSSETTNLTTTSNRPKPQPAYKGAVGYEPQPQPAPTYADDFMPLSIADRAKMRNRRSGDVAIVNASPREKAVEPEILELTSDDDELAIQPKKKGKSKAKATRTMPSPSPQPSLPMATSPLIPTSTLPPSDPPILTPSEFSVGLPPIAVMPQVPSSSASSKRKRTPERDDLFGDDELDGLDMDVEPLPAKKAKVKKVKEKKAKKAGDEGAEKSKARPKAKKKEKEKNVKDREIQQNFKSTEFVNDSDDELHLDNAAAGPSGSGSSQSHAWVEADKEPEPPRKKQKSGAKGKEKDNAPNTSRKGRVVVSDDEDEYIDGEQKGKVVVVEIEKKRQAKQCKPVAEPEPSTPGPSSRSDEEDADREVPTKENIDPRPPSDTPAKGKQPIPKPDALTTETPDNKPTSLTSRYSIAPRTRSTPMSELIRRVNAQPGSPFSPASSTKTATPYAKPGTPTAYSPYLKSSRSMLSRIAPLHPNRRTPPPLPPPPPPKKKSKKELELEEKWEEELVDSVGGMTEWLALSDQERKDMRKMKREKELYGWEE